MNEPRVTFPFMNKQYSCPAVTVDFLLKLIKESCRKVFGFPSHLLLYQLGFLLKHSLHVCLPHQLLKFNTGE